MFKNILLSLILMAPLGVNAMGCFGLCKRSSTRIVPIETSLDASLVSPALATGRADTIHAHREIEIKRLSLTYDLAKAASELAEERELDERINVTEFVLRHGGETHSPKTAKKLLRDRRKIEINQDIAGREADRFATVARIAQKNIAELIEQNKTI